MGAFGRGHDRGQRWRRYKTFDHSDAFSGRCNSYLAGDAGLYIPCQWFEVLLNKKHRSSTCLPVCGIIFMRLMSPKYMNSSSPDQENPHWNKVCQISYSSLLPHDVEILTNDTSSVSESTKTISFDSEKDGTAINRTACPAGPVMTLVPNSGWHPTK